MIQSRIQNGYPQVCETESLRLTGFKTLGQDGDGSVGIVEWCVRPLEETSELLKNLGVRRIILEYPFVSVFGFAELHLRMLQG